MIQVKFCYFLGCIDPYAWLEGWGGGQAVQGRLSHLPRTCITKVKIWMFIPLFSNISECEDVSPIIIIQVSLIHFASGVGGQAVQGSLSCQPRPPALKYMRITLLILLF